MTALLLVLNAINALLFAGVLTVLVMNWRVHTPRIGKVVVSLIATSFLVLAAMMFLKGAFPCMQKWGAAFVVLGLLSNYLERRYRRRMRSGIHE